MGVRGLMKRLKGNAYNYHLDMMQGGKVLAIDAFSLMYAGVENSYTTIGNMDGYISYCIEEVEMYRRFGIKPIFVFDGASVPVKLKSIKERRLSEREGKRKEGEDLMRMGKVKEANLKFKDSVDINPYHVYKLIQVLKQHQVEFVVAPYEADAQLAWMAHNWGVDAAVTNDSDLILFGCPKVLTDVDRKGFCQLIEFKQLRGDRIFGRLTFQQFFEACLFVGCDYLEVLPEMNFNKAAKFILQHSSYEKVITHLVDSNQWTKAYPKLEDYKRKYEMAVLTYKHQRIYNMHAEKIDYLTIPPEDLQVENDKLAFLGPFIPKDIVQGIAKGKLNPKTQKPLYDGGRGCGTNKRIHEGQTDVYSGHDHEPDPFSHKNTACKFFPSGNCRHGAKCRYFHEEHTDVYSGRDHRPDPLSQKNTYHQKKKKKVRRTLLNPQKYVGKVPPFAVQHTKKCCTLDNSGATLRKW